MRELRTTIDIDAPPAVVWAVLTDFPAYREWNPFIVRVEGEAAQNAVLTVEMQRPLRKPMIFRPTVQKAQLNRELRWLGKIFLGGLFDGEHFFELEGISGNRTKFTHGEMFTGLVVDYFADNFLIGLEDDFKRMNEALKRRVEERAKLMPSTPEEAPKRLGDVLRGR